MQRTGLQVANTETFLVFEQYIELAAITGEAGLCVEQGAKHFLHLGNVRANCGMATQLFLQVGSG
ncbi:hypothetical protein D3C78_1984000 [compost metagenome]